jgi:hypothetical protein
MVEPAGVTTRTRNLKVLLDRKIDTPVGHNDVARWFSKLKDRSKDIKNSCE